MASKYASLPDIDVQPDVYETPDIMDDDAPIIGDNASDEDNEDVDRTSMSIKDASHRFKDSIVDATETDFSDQLTRRKKAMYRTYMKRSLETNEYEIMPRDMALEETKLQKLRRLMFEVQELGEEVDKENETSSVTQNELGVHQTELLSQISFLQSDLARLQERMADIDLADQGTTAYRNRVDEAKTLIKRLEAYKSSKLTPAPAPASAEDSAGDTVMIDKNEKGDVVTYELYYTPETAKLHHQSHLSELDERIAKMEKLVGSRAGEGIEDLPPGIATSSLVHLLSRLEQQITVLAQPRQLETVSRRIKVLNGELERLNELRSGRKDNSALGFDFSNVGGSNLSTVSPANAGKDAAKDASAGSPANIEQKVSHLFETVEKIEPLLNLTPALLTRLKALQGLHAEAATFGKSVKTISGEQTRITDELKSLSSTCELLTNSLSENESSIQKNISIIDTRMTELMKRVEALQQSS